MANYNLIMGLIIMVTINVGLGLFDIAVVSYNEDYEGTIDFSSSPAASITKNNSLYSGITDDSSVLNIESSESVSEETGTIFTDIFKSINNWFSEKLAPLGFFGDVLKQPAGFMSDIGVPAPFVTAFGAVWWIMFTLLFIAAIKGDIR